MKIIYWKQITLICILTVLSLVATACNRSEAKLQTLSETSATITAENYATKESYASNEAYAKILNGDLSDFAGTWINIHGERRQLYADGIFGPPGTISNFGKNDEGTSDAYKWYVLEGINEPIPGEYGYFVYLYPAGAALDIEGLNIINGYHIRGTLANDSAKDLIVLRPRPQHDALQPDYFVFYREGEAPNAETLFTQAWPGLIQAQTKAALEEFKKILRNETGFIYENSVNVYLSFFQSGNRENNFGHFAIYDMDGNGIPALVLHNMNNGDSLILHYDNRRVYGKKHADRAMRYLKKDATFNSKIGILQIMFRNDDQRLICLVESGTKEFDTYITYQDSKENVIWHELTNKNINNLSALYNTVEDSIAIVETKKIINSKQNENDFEIYSNGTIFIYTGSDKSVVIPARIGDVPVSAIGDNAFSFKDIESIILPDSIIEIERVAFSGNKLKSITIPNNVIYIGLQAFTGNPLTSITIGNNVELVGGTYTSFPNGFDEYYNDNDKKAGMYVYSNGRWNLR